MTAVCVNTASKGLEESSRINMVLLDNIVTIVNIVSTMSIGGISASIITICGYCTVRYVLRLRSSPFVFVQLQLQRHRRLKRPRRLRLRPQKSAKPRARLLQQRPQRRTAR